MAWYDDLLSKENNPLAGVGESLTKLNLFGAEVPEQFTQMNDAGLLGKGVYEAAIADADKRSKRDAIIQGLLAYGSQDFNRNTGSIIPYLTKPVAVAMNAAQKPYDKLSTNAMNTENFKQLKLERDTNKAVRDIYSEGLFEDGKYNVGAVNKLYEQGKLTEANAISAMIARNEAAVKTLADTHERKEGFGGEIYYIPKVAGTAGVYKLDKNGQPTLSQNGFTPKRKLTPVGEAGLVDVTDPYNPRKIIEGVRAPDKVSEASNADVKETRQLIPSLYPNIDVTTVSMDNARVIANEVNRLRATPNGQTMSQNDLTMMAIKNIGALQPSNKDGKGTLDFGKRNYNIAIPNTLGVSDVINYDDLIKD